MRRPDEKPPHEFASCAVLGAGLLVKRRRGRRLELDAQHTFSAPNAIALTKNRLRHGPKAVFHPPTFPNFHPLYAIVQGQIIADNCRNDHI